MDFVQRVRVPGADFVPVERRVAVFDNDGTLWPEQPLPTELLFMLSRIRALAPQHPQWRGGEPPFERVIEGDVKALAASGKRGFAALATAQERG